MVILHGLIHGKCGYLIVMRLAGTGRMAKVHSEIRAKCSSLNVTGVG